MATCNPSTGATPNALKPYLDEVVTTNPPEKTPTPLVSRQPLADDQAGIPHEANRLSSKTQQAGEQVFHSKFGNLDSEVSREPTTQAIQVTEDTEPSDRGSRQRMKLSKTTVTPFSGQGHSLTANSNSELSTTTTTSSPLPQPQPPQRKLINTSRLLRTETPRKSDLEMAQEKVEQLNIKLKDAVEGSQKEKQLLSQRRKARQALAAAEKKAAQ